MFEFYKVVVDADTNAEEIKKFQYEETPETIKLKEKLEREIAQYENHQVTCVDRYYHCDVVENTYPISLSKSVFKDDVFVGYMIDNVLYVKAGECLPVYKNVRGATSIIISAAIRRK